jgi:diguanylate cyclase (GGDEF)-like protein
MNDGMRRLFALAALIVGLLLIPTTLAVAKLDHNRNASALERALRSETDEHGSALEDYFARSRSIILLTANSPAFANVLAEPGTRAQKVRRHGRNLAEVTHHLRYLERLYPTAIGEACFIDLNGEEFARAVRGDIAKPGDLSTTEEETPFFAPTFALGSGRVHQTAPYVSPDTKEWVIANATVIPQRDGRKRAFVHFEVTVESFRRAMHPQTKAAADDLDVRVIDARTGRVVIDSSRPQRVGAALGVPRDARFAHLAQTAGRQGVGDVAGQRVAYRRVAGTAGNANEWIVVASAGAPTSFLESLGAVSFGLLGIGLALIALGALWLRAGNRELEAHANSDALTGLGNRRKLLADLERRMRNGEPGVLTLFDLNGFKNYNDSFGHAAGDALLVRLGNALADAVAPFGGHAYRPGGDEFCVIGRADRRSEMEAAACAALSEHGEGFAISTAFGSVVFPRQAVDVTDAMRRADEAMYAQKQSGRATAGRQSSDVLLRALSERHPDLGEHVDGVAELAEGVGARLGIEGEELVQLRHAAALHDIGKVAIPDEIISKPGPLDADEWAFMRRHTIVGERIIAAAPALGAAARLVRSSHETWDGGGYPDALAGEEIALGARIIAVCDAFDAMTSERPYARARTITEALAELRRCAGTQFDPDVVAAVEVVLAEQATAKTAA